MGQQIADRSNPSRQMTVNEDGSINTNSYNEGVVVSSTNPLPVYIGTAVDIQVGAVEIKDGDLGTRANVRSDGINNALVIRENSPLDLQGGGKTAVGISTVALSFTGTTRYVSVSADISNTAPVYIGKNNVSSTGNNAFGKPLYAGQSVTFPYNDSSNTLYVVGSSASQNVWSGALE